ncbi:D-glutamate cyclase, mitochondrial-like [Glandiceps talaboti]
MSTRVVFCVARSFLYRRKNPLPYKFRTIMSSQPNDVKTGKSVEDVSTMLPKDVRLMIRNKKVPAGTGTAGLCEGYTQANMAIIHKSVADDFEKFCHANTGPLPLIFKSQPGQYTAPKISQYDSDIRTDVPMYCVMEDGVKTKEVENLMGYEKEMEDMSSFYLGCSFTFDKALLEAKVPLRNLEQNCTNVSMYQTNVHCYPVGVFDCTQVMSMKPIPVEMIETAYQVTHPMEDVHGAPAHIGDPAMIGVEDVQKVNMGASIKFHDGDVPVFWACGVTGRTALSTAKLHLAFTHRPGSMYISDTPAMTHDASSDQDKPKVIGLRDSPFFASVTAESVLNKVHALEKSIQDDPGCRGISSLHVKGELIKSALSLSHASSVAITTGFPCLVDKIPPYENDGLSGAIAMATMLQTQGKEVTMVVDTMWEQLMRDIVADLVSKGVVAKSIDVTSFPPPGQKATLETAREFLQGKDELHPKYQHLVAIERVGRASDKTWRTMRAVDISSKVSQVDLLFDAAKDMTYVSTTGIGDGGNELGMGKVKDKVIQHITKGNEIACEVAADYLITAGVSDWGGYALSMALYLVALCPIHDRYLRKAVGFPLQSKDKLLPALPTVEKQEAMLAALIDHGIHDGVLQELSMSVDGLPFHPVHADKIKELTQISV